MLRPTPELDELERRYAREWLATLTYKDALAWFSAAWQDARKLNPDFPGDRTQDLKAELAIARALNGLPPAD